MKTLAVQASNGTYNTAGQGGIWIWSGKELLAEIDRIGESYQLSGACRCFPRRPIFLRAGRRPQKDENNEITLQIGSSRDRDAGCGPAIIWEARSCLLDKTDFTSVDKANDVHAVIWMHASGGGANDVRASFGAAYSHLAAHS